VSPDSPEKPTGGSPQKFYSHKNSFIYVGQTREFGLAGVAYTGESIINLQGLPMLFNGQFLKKPHVGVKYWLIGRDSCFKRTFLT
jgi:hypothetical protein